MELPVYRIRGSQGLDTWILSFCIPMASSCTLLGPLHLRQPSPKGQTCCGQQPPGDDCVQDSTIQATEESLSPSPRFPLGAHTLPQPVPLIRAAQETRVMLPRLPTCPRRPEGRKRVLWATRMSQARRLNAAAGSQNAAPPPALQLPLMHWFPLTPQESQARSSFAYNISRRISALFACSVSGFRALPLPGQLRPQVGSGCVLFCGSSSEERLRHGRDHCSRADNRMYYCPAARISAGGGRGTS